MRIGVLMRDKNDVNTSEKTGMKVETTAEVSELRQINLLALDIWQNSHDVPFHSLNLWPVFLIYNVSCDK